MPAFPPLFPPPKRLPLCWTGALECLLVSSCGGLQQWRKPCDAVFRTARSLPPVRWRGCWVGSPAEYVAWGDTNAPEADRREASGLLVELVEKDHPASQGRLQRHDL